jgi:hypothetical protein
MAYCPSCGTPVASNAVGCHQCGAGGIISPYSRWKPCECPPAARFTYRISFLNKAFIVGGVALGLLVVAKVLLS